MALRMDSPHCDRARAWASLRLDGEISELEEALLVAHLRRCAACSEYEETTRAAVLTLRAQPLERIENPVAVAGRRRIPLRPAAVARVAAVVAAVVGVSAVLGTQAAKGPTSVPSSPSSPQLAVEDNDLEQLRALRVIQLGGRPPRGSGMGQFGAVLNRQMGPPS
jgi:predicted anti-sigma-YlaC factor YlaD